MSEISTVTPNAPVGQISPEVPLGISASLAQTVQPVDNPPLIRNDNLDQKWIFLDSFEIKKSMTIGTNLFNWDSYNPFMDVLKQKYDATATFDIPTMVHAMKDAYWATFLNMEYEMKFEPVKVTDSRVELFIQKNYDGRKDDATLKYSDAATSSFNQENEIVVLDSPTTAVLFKPTLFQMQTKANNVAGIVNFAPSELDKIWPAFIPTTTIAIKLQSRFINNNLQPDSFDVNVWIRPIIKTISQLTSRTLSVTRYGSPIYKVNYVPLPWWMSNPIDTYVALSNNYPALKSSYTMEALVQYVRELRGKNYEDEAIANAVKKYVKLK